MDYDDIQSDDDQVQLPPNDDVQDFNDVDDDDEEGGGNGNWNQEPKAKTRKRLIKKSDDHSSMPPEFNDFADEDDVGEPEYGSFPEEEEEEPSPSISKKRKDKGMMKEGGEKRRKEKKLRKDKYSSSAGGSDGGKGKLSLRRKKGNDEGDPEMKEMWDTIAGGDSEVCLLSLLFMYFHKFYCFCWWDFFKSIVFASLLCLFCGA